MKVFIIAMLMVSGVAQAKDQNYKCLCNLNACLGAPNKQCVSIIRCKKTTAADYAETVGNHKALFVFNNLTYCVDPRQ